jgi:hypothetical protein
MAVRHHIVAWLFNNPLTENPDDFIARVSSDRSLSVRDICNLAAERGGADISSNAMEHAVTLFQKEMRYQLCNGFSINTGTYVAAPHIRGVFTGPDDTFDPTRHTLLFELQQGADLRAELDKVEIEVKGVAAAIAHIAEVFDVGSNTTNNLLTVGNNLRVRGREIKIKGDDLHPETGVYFVSQDAGSFGARFLVDPSMIVVNNPSEIIFVNPAFDANTFKLEIVTQFAGNAYMLKQPRTLVLDKVLTVA